MNPAEAIEAAEQAEREAENGLGRAAYTIELGRLMYEMGRCAAEADMARSWAEVANPVARGGASYAELEERRWGPGGRAHFGDPRPGDFPGRTEPEASQPEPEAEA